MSEAEMFIELCIDLEEKQNKVDTVDARHYARNCELTLAVETLCEEIVEQEVALDDESRAKLREVGLSVGADASRISDAVNA